MDTLSRQVFCVMPERSSFYICTAAKPVEKFKLGWGLCGWAAQLTVVKGAHKPHNRWNLNPLTRYSFARSTNLE